MKYEDFMKGIPISPKDEAAIKSLNVEMEKHTPENRIRLTLSALITVGMIKREEAYTNQQVKDLGFHGIRAIEAAAILSFIDTFAKAHPGCAVLDFFRQITREELAEAMKAVMPLVQIAQDASIEKIIKDKQS